MRKVLFHLRSRATDVVFSVERWNDDYFVIPGLVTTNGSAAAVVAYVDDHVGAGNYEIVEKEWRLPRAELLTRIRATALKK